ncbi:probable E3 ubiquitin-protein ligase RHG1A [Euphorbia lathyris]|uniref:probable E3 ubiquitin-protein ligase RHG1A n=1 Tax=Euphorbia lathyris TaxID=212925 RepID=UPI0033142E2C
MEGHQYNNSHDFSRSSCMNYGLNANNEMNDVEDADPIRMALPDQSAAVPNNQIPQNVTNQTQNRGLLIPPFQQARSSHVHHQNIDLNPMRGADANPVASGSSNSTPVVISSGISGYVVAENNNENGNAQGADGRRLACKRRTPEGSSSQSTRFVGETSRINEEDEESEDVARRVHGGCHQSNNEQQRGDAVSVVIGLSGLSAAEREEHARRTRVLDRARQMVEEDHEILRNIRRRLDANSNVSQVQQQPQSQPLPLPAQPAVSTFPFQHSIHPGFLHPSPPQPVMQPPVPHPAMPTFSQFANSTMNAFQRTGANSGANLNRQARPPMVPPATTTYTQMVTTTYTPTVSGTTSYTLNGGQPPRIMYPHETMPRGSTSGSNAASSSNSSTSGSVPPPAVQFFDRSNVLDQYGQMIPVENIAVISEPRGRPNYTFQQLPILMEGRVRGGVRRGGNHARRVSANQYMRTGTNLIPPGQTSIQQEIAMDSLAADQSRNRIVSEVRNALALVRRNGYLQLEGVMVIDHSVLPEPDAHGDTDTDTDTDPDIDEMSYEELLELEERMGTVSTGLSNDVILANLKHNKYPLASSSEDVQCCICQEEFKKGEDVGKLECSHEYHYDCIRQWLAQKNNCPICKMIGLNV